MSSSASGCQRLREVYYRAVLSECPQRDVLFHCALGLSLTCMAGDLDLAVFILEGLLSSGYMVQQCRLALAKCAHRDGRILRARRLLTDCLRDDPTDSDARDFQAEFDTAVKRDGKIAVYGVIAAVAAIAIGWTAYRQTGCSSPSTALLSHTAPSGAAVSTSLSAQ